MLHKDLFKKKLILLNGSFFHMDIEHLKSYAETSLGLFKKEIENVEANIFGEETEEAPDEMTEELINYEKHKLDAVFPKMLVESIFVLGYSLFESKLNSACGKYYAPIPSTISLSDLNGRGVARALKYLSKVIGLKDVPLPDQLKRISFYTEIRNSIIHNSSKIDKKNTELIRFIESQEALKLDKSFTIGIRHVFLNIVFTDYENVITGVFKGLSSLVEENITSNKKPIIFK